MEATHGFTKADLAKIAAIIEADEGRMALFELAEGLLKKYDKLKKEHDELRERQQYQEAQARPARITVEFLDEDRTVVFECDNIDLCRHNLVQQLAPKNGYARNQQSGVGILTILAYTNPNPITEDI